MDSIQCRSSQNDIDRLFAGEIEEDARLALMEHVSACSECGGHYALVEEIAAQAAAEPDDDDFLAMRRGVLRSIREERTASWWRRLPLAAAVSVAVAGAALLLALGWVGGRSGAGPLDAARPASGNPDIVLAKQMQREARANAALEDVENSPFRYANVRMEELEDGRVRIGFDVSRHLELTLQKTDPLVTEVLVQSMLDAGSVGTKLKAIDQAENVLDPKIRGALVKTMLGDPNLGVRLQAQQRLVERSGDREIADALVAVLENEESVQMRLIAIDYLTRSRIDPDRLQKAVEAGEPAGRGAVRVKAREYIATF